MREIKFRVYDQINKVMYTPEMDKEICNLWAIPKSQGGVLSYPNGVLMQYTGLKDKNGREIYEGDIVAFENAIGLEDNFGAIQYESSRYEFYIENEKTWLWEGLFNISCASLEVIGNTYENPELLEEK